MEFLDWNEGSCDWMHPVNHIKDMDPIFSVFQISSVPQDLIVRRTCFNIFKNSFWLEIIAKLEIEYQDCKIQ